MSDRKKLAGRSRKKKKHHRTQIEFKEKFQVLKATNRKLCRSWQPCSDMDLKALMIFAVNDI